VPDRSTEAPRRPDPLATLHDEVAARLRTVCRDMPPEQFAALVREIVRVKLKYDPPPAVAR
jgi:hypothetical protein